MWRRILAVAVLGVLPLTAAADDDGFDQLTEDGSWAKFYVTVRGTNNDVNLNVEFTLSSVGKVQENGKDCRWIEMLSNNADDGTRFNLFKLLIPEEALKQGPLGRADALRAWAAEMENAVQAASGDELAPVSFLFPDNLNDAQRPDEKETVDWQRGKLECAVLTGTSTTQLGTQDIKIEHRYLLAPEVPFGMGGFKSAVHFAPDTVFHIEARLLDAGTGAASALPNSQ
jgi:hypothetical protein